MRSMVHAWVVALVLLFAVNASAHDSRPGYLEITETSAGRYDVLWRTPLLSGMRLPISLKLPAEARKVTEPSEREFPDSIVERRIVEVPGGLGGKRIEIVGLQATITDVLARVQLLDGTSTTTLIRPPEPWVDIIVERSTLETAKSFLLHGIEHIAFGVDHLLFVFGLLLIVRSPWMLVKTITAFTVAHSITLALATFGVIQIRAAPLEALIAMSILFLGPEVVRAWRGQTSLTIRHPWVVAFAFGLLHGVGFASGLAAVGLPRNDIPLALLMFNVGVEFGQLAFVAAVLVLERSLRGLGVVWPKAVKWLPAYAVGSLGAFWTLQRVVPLFSGVQ